MSNSVKGYWFEPEYSDSEIIEHEQEECDQSGHNSVTVSENARLSDLDIGVYMLKIVF